ncbi:MAG TPA: beta-galactosidase [Candidatus Cybelea sp.]|nr:beta-galactosidase [Candidatus Cybelea sp.]
MQATLRLSLLALALVAGRSTIAAEPSDRWPDYQIIMWQPQTRAAYESLKRLGITAGKITANRDDAAGAADTVPDPAQTDLIASGLRWYVENIATDFYSPYHKWTPGKPKNWLFLEAQQAYRDNPLSDAAFMRKPSLSDPEWLAKIRNRLTRVVTSNRQYDPLYYALGDETGIAELDSFWDFDVSPASLDGMRAWLRERYGSLDALNAQWGTNYASWSAVRPMLTRDALRRTDGNFSAWADFKEWMDVAFAGALASGRDAVHAADPKALAALEGGQEPGWGGYDYARLAKSVDVIELYDLAGNMEIVRSLNPNVVLLTTSFESGPAEAHRVWRDALRGSRGLILWDETGAFAAADGSVGARGKAAASYVAELRGGLGAMLIGSRPSEDPVAILYSPASMRARWIAGASAAAHAAGGGNLAVDGQSPDADILGFTKVLDHLGLGYRIVTAEMIEQGVLQSGAYRALILPQAVALSAAEADEIRSFVNGGGTAIADAVPGRFDEHCRRLAEPQLADVFDSSGADAASNIGEGKAILAAGKQPGRLQWMLNALGDAGVRPRLTVRSLSGEPVSDVEIRIFERGDATIVALQRDLADAGILGRLKSRLSSGETVQVTMDSEAFVHDIRANRDLGRLRQVTLRLDDSAPTLLALTGTAELPPGFAVGDRPRTTP